MSDQIQRDDGEWQMLLNNAYSMVDSLTNRVEARDAQVESLQRENAALQSLADTAGMDAERAITRADKAELDLKCLQESTVDAKAYQALQRENEELKRLSGIALGHLECTTGDHRIDAVRVLREAFGLPVTPLGEAP